MLNAGDRAILVQRVRLAFIGSDKAKAILETIDREISIAAKEGKAFCTCDPGLDSSALVETIAIRSHAWEEGEMLC